MKIIDLFSGIGGFALAARNTGHETVLFCEIEPFAQAVLKKNFPGIPIYSDVKELTGKDILQYGQPDEFILTAGFPGMHEMPQVRDLCRG